MVHPANGFYVRNGHEYASQSTVVGETDPIFNPAKVENLQIWRNREPDWEEIVAEACERGTILHYKIEKALGLDVEQIALPDEERQEYLKIKDYSKWAKPFIMELKKAKENPGAHLAIEHEKFSDSFGFACTTDLNVCISFKKKGWDYTPISIGGPGDPYTVIDWKNVKDKIDKKTGKLKAKSRSEHADNFMQLGANALAHNEMVRNGELDAPLITQGAICALYSWREPRFHILDLDQLTKQAIAFAERANAYSALHGPFPRPIPRPIPETPEE
jgi:hypothetical protein